MRYSHEVTEFWEVVEVVGEEGLVVVVFCQAGGSHLLLEDLRELLPEFGVICRRLPGDRRVFELQSGVEWRIIIRYHF